MTPLSGVLLIEPQTRVDARGYFFEVWRHERYATLGVHDTFVQDNVSFSHGGVLRGLHLQHPHGQGKLISVVSGEIFDVAVDMRRGSPTFGAWLGYTLSAADPRQLYIPVGFAHGFVVTGAEAVVTYKVTEYHQPAAELAVAWNDPDIGIVWPVPEPILSERDRDAPTLSELDPDRLPVYVPGDDE